MNVSNEVCYTSSRALGQLCSFHTILCVCVCVSQRINGVSTYVLYADADVC